MKVPLSWLREFVAVPADVSLVASRLAACGFAVESIEGEVIDFEVTANRPDCLSVYGLAREAAVAFDLPLAPLAETAAIGTGAATPAVTVSIGEHGCGRYALAVAHVVVAPSPDWLSSRLTAVGVRPINNVVDVTNYVMLELGHPMHAFDVARLAGPEIRVRRAVVGEKLTTLDGEERTLDEAMLVIADRDRAVAVAGVMGGMTSEVIGTTTVIALESAWFLPTSVRATSRKLGLKTEASARFERGADPAVPVIALRRALALLAQVGAGTISGGITDVVTTTLDVRQVDLRRSRLERLLGAAVPDADIARILHALGFGLSATADGWRVNVPSFRVDVSREADLIEEVGRHWGLDRLPATFPVLRAMPRSSDPQVSLGRDVRRLLCGAGLQEAVTFTFMEADWAASFTAAGETVVIANPLSEKFAVLRPSLLPGLIDALAYSRRRESASVRLFEIGAAFSPLDEGVRVGWVLTGPRGDHWSGSAGSFAFADAKGIAELLVGAFGLSLDISSADDLPWLAAGQRARIGVNGRPAGWVGRIVAVRGAPDSDEIFGGEIELSALARAERTTARLIGALPRFPSMVRDLSFFVDERLPAADLRGTIRSNAPGTLVALREFDRYQGKGVPDGQVSLSVRLTFRDADRTLTDTEVQHAVDDIVRAVALHHSAVLRGKQQVT
jgi:phenylalanyl-tRNA synthetase beta chain